MSWLSDWAKRVKIILDHNDIDAALSNFPHLVYLSASSGHSNKDVSFVFDELGSDANRKKIAVTKADGITQCYVEIEKWDHVNEKAWLWVKIPDVDPDVDTELYLYYDSAHADNNDWVGDPSDAVVHNVWDDDFVLVLHMEEGLVDSSGNNNGAVRKYGVKQSADAGTTTTVIKETGNWQLNYSNDYYNGWTCEITSGPATGEKRTVTDYRVISAQTEKEIELDSEIVGLDAGAGYWIYSEGAYPPHVPGTIGSAIQLNGVDQYLSHGLDATEYAGDKITLEAFINPDDLSGTQGILIENGPMYWRLAGDKHALGIRTDPIWLTVTGTEVLSADEMYLTGIYDGANIQVWNDAVFDNERELTGDFVGNGTQVIGCYNNGGEFGNPSAYYAGLINELRVSKAVRSDAWIKATKESLWDHLNDFGAEEEMAEEFSKILIETLSLGGTLQRKMAICRTETIQLWDVIHGAGKDIAATVELPLVTKKRILDMFKKTDELAFLAKEMILKRRV